MKTITKNIQSSLLQINRFCNESVMLAKSAIQHRPSNRIDFRNLLHRISTEPQNQTRNNNLARQLLLLDKEIVYLQYEGFQPFVLKKINLLKIKYYSGNIKSESESKSTINTSNNDVPIRSANVDKSEKKVGKIAFMITKQQKNILGQELLYTRAQIKTFKPIEALLIVEHGLIMNGNGDIINNGNEAVAMANDGNDGDIDTSASKSTANGNDIAAHWRHVLDRLLMENNQIMEKQQQQQQEQEQQDEIQDEIQTNVQIKETRKGQQKESRHESTNELQNTTSSVQLGFEQPLPLSNRYVYDNENNNNDNDRSHALAIVTDSVNVNDNGGGFPVSTAVSVSTEANATASQPISEKKAVDASGRDENEAQAQDKNEVKWYEVVQIIQHSTQVVALYKTRKEAEEFLEIKTDLLQKRLGQKKDGNGRGGDDYEQGIEYRVQKRAS